MLIIILFLTVQADGNEKAEIHATPISKENAASNKIMSTVPVTTGGKLAGPIVSSGMTTALELRNPQNGPQPCAVVPPDAWLQVWLKVKSILNVSDDILVPIH